MRNILNCSILRSVYIYTSNNIYRNINRNSLDIYSKNKRLIK